MVEGAEPEVIGLDRRFARSYAALSMASTAPEEAPIAPHGASGTDQRLDRLVARRSALATWRSFHVPLTWALMITALIHTIAAIYYAAR